MCVCGTRQSSRWRDEKNRASRAESRPDGRVLGCPGGASVSAAGVGSGLGQRARGTSTPRRWPAPGPASPQARHLHVIPPDFRSLEEFPLEGAWQAGAPAGQGGSLASEGTGQAVCLPRKPGRPDSQVGACCLWAYMLVLSCRDSLHPGGTSPSLLVVMVMQVPKRLPSCRVTRL